MLTETATLTTNQQNAIIGGAITGAMLGTISTLLIVIFILYVIASWRIFKKAGEPGWKAIIPIYNVYISFKIAGMKAWFWIMLLVSIVGSIIITSNQVYLYTDAIDLSTIPVVVIVTLVVMCIVELFADILYCIRLSKAFRHGIGFSLGLFFLPIIFWFILAFGKSKYDKKILKD